MSRAPLRQEQKVLRTLIVKSNATLSNRKLIANIIINYFEKFSPADIHAVILNMHIWYIRLTLKNRISNY